MDSDNEMAVHREPTGEGVNEEMVDSAANECGRVDLGDLTGEYQRANAAVAEAVVIDAK
jgi:hypothetical protein